MPESFSEVLGRYVQRSHRSAGQVAVLSGVPKRTIVNWLSGTVKKPQRWQDIIQVAAALELNENETDKLLLAARHAPIVELRQTETNERDYNLLNSWPEPYQPPFQAIADLRHFVGREAALRELEQLLLSGRRVAICALHGMGGVGKTSLAAHLAYRLRHHFADGVLWARLDTMDTMTILSIFAEAYGKDVSSFHDVAGRATVVRNFLAGKRVLIVLDNAENSAQVRPLLPPTTGQTAVLLTTRYDLAVMDDMERYPLQSFDPAQDESGQLFAQFLGKNYVAEHRESLRKIADLLGHLPLAVAIVAGQLAANSHLLPAAILTELHNNKRRLDMLIREDRSVRLSFDLSYNALLTEKQSLFAALGAFGGDDFGATAAAYVTEVEPEMARAILAEFVSLSLVQQVHNGRYRLHPLLREYAREKIRDERPYDRMVRYYIQHAVDYQHDYPVLAQEFTNISAALDTAVAHQLDDNFISGVGIMAPYWELRGLYQLCDQQLNQARETAQNGQHEAQIAPILYHMGNMANKRGQQQTAKELLDEALHLAQKFKDHETHLNALNLLGAVNNARGNYEQAKSYWQMCLHRAVSFQSRRMEIAARVNLGHLAYNAGDMVRAEQSFKIAEESAKEQQANVALAVIYFNLGELAYFCGSYKQAERQYQQALELAQRLNDRKRLCRLLINQGTLHVARGDLAEAENCYKQGLKIAQQDGNPKNEGLALIFLGRVLALTERYAEADTALQVALSLSQNCEYQELVILAHMYLGLTAGRQKEWPATNNLLETSLHEARQAHYLLLSCEALNLWGHFLAEQSLSTRAETCFREAYDFAAPRDLKEYAAIALWGLAKVAEAQGDVREAFSLANKSKALFDNIDHRYSRDVAQWLSMLVDYNAGWNIQ